MLPEAVFTNWLNVERTTAPITDLIVCRAQATLKLVFTLGGEDELLMKSSSSAIRGATPAGAQYTSEDAAASASVCGSQGRRWVSVPGRSVSELIVEVLWADTQGIPRLARPRDSVTSPGRRGRRFRQRTSDSGRLSI